MTLRSPLIAALALALALSACGKSEEKAAETLAEKALEANSGQDVDVDIDDDGDSQTVTIQTEEGTIRQSSGENVALPSDFPTDIALPASYKVMSVMTMGPVTSVVMEVPEAPADVFANFKSRQPDQGWKETLSMQGTDGSMLGFEKGERSMLVNLSRSEGGGTTVSLSLQSKN